MSNFQRQMSNFFNIFQIFPSFVSDSRCVQDCIWMETGKPILAQATQFAQEVRAAVPHQMLAYNLSPSFNWDSAGMTDAQMESFIWDLATWISMISHGNSISL